MFKTPRHADIRGHLAVAKIWKGEYPETNQALVRSGTPNKPARHRHPTVVIYLRGATAP